MASLEQNNSFVIAFGGGGSTGQTAAGFHRAVEAGLVEGVPEAQVAAFVTTCDDGSKTGDTRNMYADYLYDGSRVPALGDVRRSISALSYNQSAADILEDRLDDQATPSTVQRYGYNLLEALSSTPSRLSSDSAWDIIDRTHEVSRDLYRRDPNGLRGYSLGHVVMLAQMLEYDDVDTASRETSDLMVTRGPVMPVSLVSHGLKLEDGVHAAEGPRVIMGEHRIGKYIPIHPNDLRYSLVSDDPNHTAVTPNPRIVRYMDDAHKFVLGPGSIPTSVIPTALALTPLLHAMAARDQELTLLGNLVEDDETPFWSGLDYVRRPEEQLGRSFDEVIFNANVEGLDKAIVLRPEDREALRDYRVIARDLLSDEIKQRRAHDPIAHERSAVMHHHVEMARALVANFVQRNHAELIGV